jgi:hypothetical protein
MLRVADRMSTRGWLPGVVREPRSMHLMLSLLHEPALHDYMRDLRECVAEVRAGAAKGAGVSVTY